MQSILKNTFKKNPVLFAAIVLTGIENPIKVLAEQLADKNGWYLEDYKNGNFKFYDVINNKRFTLSEEHVYEESIKCYAS